MHLFLRLLNPILEENNSILGKKMSNLGAWWLIFFFPLAAASEQYERASNRGGAGVSWPTGSSPFSTNQPPLALFFLTLGSEHPLSTLEAICSSVAFHSLSLVINLS